MMHDSLLMGGAEAKQPRGPRLATLRVIRRDAVQFVMVSAGVQLSLTVLSLD